MNQPTASIQLLTGVLLFYGVRECFAFTKSLKPKLVKEYVCPKLHTPTVMGKYEKKCGY